MRRLIPNWDYLAWFDVKRARDWQAVVWLGVFLVAMAIARIPVYRERVEGLV